MTDLFEKVMLEPEDGGADPEEGDVWVAVHEHAGYEQGLAARGEGIEDCQGALEPGRDGVAFDVRVVEGAEEHGTDTLAVAAQGHEFVEVATEMGHPGGWEVGCQRNLGQKMRRWRLVTDYNCWQHQPLSRLPHGWQEENSGESGVALVSDVVAGAEVVEK